MDQDGISPIHHENFDWTTLHRHRTRRSQLRRRRLLQEGHAAGATQENQKVTRFTLFNDMKRSPATGSRPVRSAAAAGRTAPAGRAWRHGYDERTTALCELARLRRGAALSLQRRRRDAASTATPATLFVPMFAPDEPGDAGRRRRYNLDGFSATTTGGTTDTEQQLRLDPPKDTCRNTSPCAPYGTDAAIGDDGPELRAARPSRSRR